MELPGIAISENHRVSNRDYPEGMILVGEGVERGSVKIDL
jgi:hypothetical protein